MKAVYFTEHGGPEVLQYGELPEPIPNGNEVKIKYNGNTGYIFNIILDNIEQTKLVHSKLWKEKIYTRIYKNTISITICPIEYIKKFLHQFIINLND